jgi:hypothetical protein
VQPESGTVVPNWKDDAVIQFDEVIDEMAGGSGAGGGFGGGGGGGLTGLARLVLLSPVNGDVKVSWGRTKIRVKPKEGWKPGRVYRLELFPGVVDLRRNKLDSGRVVLFSTGAEIGHATLRGTALQWAEQRALPSGLIEAVPIPDSVGYRTLADSAGRFQLGALRPGRYLVYATLDQNSNRQRDRREAYDSTAVTVDSSATVTLFTFVHDTAGPRLRAAANLDSVSLRLEFSQPLDPAAPLDTSRIRVLHLPDSSAVTVTAVLTPRQYDSLAAAERAKADSAKQRADTAGRDTARAAGAPAAAGVPRAAGALGAAARGTPAAADTAELRRLLAQRPAPFDRVVLRLARPVVPDTRYLIRVRGARNLNGAVADGQAVLTVPKPAAPRDTTRAGRPGPPKPP